MEIKRDKAYWQRVRKVHHIRTKLREGRQPFPEEIEFLKEYEKDVKPNACVADVAQTVAAPVPTPAPEPAHETKPGVELTVSPEIPPGGPAFTPTPEIKLDSGQPTLPTVDVSLPVADEQPAAESKPSTAIVKPEPEEEKSEPEANETTPANAEEREAYAELLASTYRKVLKKINKKVVDSGETPWVPDELIDALVYPAAKRTAIKFLPEDFDSSQADAVIVLGAGGLTAARYYTIKKKAAQAARRPEPKPEPKDEPKAKPTPEPKPEPKPDDGSANARYC